MEVLISRDEPAKLAGRPLAVFDLDGTLVRGDSFIPFLVGFARRHRRIRGMLLLPFVVLLYLCRLITDRTAKQRLLKAFFRGERAADINAHADWFCENWVRPRLRDDVVARLREHLRLGHRVVLLSASPSLYVPRIAAMLEIPESVCTRVEFDGDRCTGRILGPNCKGRHKIKLLLQHLGTSELPQPTFAYGDSKSDLPLLNLASHGVLVRGNTTLESTCIE